jgi:hypothetical protein
VTVSPSQFSFNQGRGVLGGLLDPNLHAKRIDWLSDASDATLGVLNTASLAVAAIGHGLAAAKSVGKPTPNATVKVGR